MYCSASFGPDILPTPILADCFFLKEQENGMKTRACFCLLSLCTAPRALVPISYQRRYWPTVSFWKRQEKYIVRYHFVLLSKLWSRNLTNADNLADCFFLKKTGKIYSPLSLCTTQQALVPKSYQRRYWPTVSFWKRQEKYIVRYHFVLLSKLWSRYLTNADIGRLFLSKKDGKRWKLELLYVHYHFILLSELWSQYLTDADIGRLFHSEKDRKRWKLEPQINIPLSPCTAPRPLVPISYRHR